MSHPHIAWAGPHAFAVGAELTKLYNDRHSVYFASDLTEVGLKVCKKPMSLEYGRPDTADGISWYWYLQFCHSSYNILMLFPWSCRRLRGRDLGPNPGIRFYTRGTTPSGALESLATSYASWLYLLVHPESF